jgi:hypothetical protein
LVMLVVYLWSSQRNLIKNRALKPKDYLWRCLPINTLFIENADSIYVGCTISTLYACCVPRQSSKSEDGASAVSSRADLGFEIADSYPLSAISWR